MQQYVYLNGMECLWKHTQEVDNRVASRQGSQGLRARDQRKTYFLHYSHIILFLFTVLFYLKKNLSCACIIFQKNLSYHLKIQNFT